MLRIAVVTHYFPSSAEPWQGRSAYETLRVVARKAEVRVFYSNARYPSFLKSRSRRFTLDPSWSPPDVETNYYDYPALPVLSRPFNGSTAAQVLLPHVRAFTPDLIFSCVLYPHGYTGLKIARALKVPAVTMGIGSDINRIGDAISAMHTRTVLQNSNFIVTVCDDLCKKAVRMGARPDRARPILNGCDLQVFYPRDRIEARKKLGIDPSAQAVVYIGRMDLRKGLRELVQAAVLIHAQRPNLHVYIVGDGPDRPTVQSAIGEGKASGYIHALPSCAFDQVAVWMAAADVITLPSYMEGCPNAVLEALACGRPVVATSVGGIPEIMNETCGCLVPPQNPQALAHGLNSVLDRTWNPAEISAVHGRSWNTVADELLAVFQALVPAK
jgi:teichuronic acid biosynthesis glycosyltransferase TuaC